MRAWSMATVLAIAAAGSPVAVAACDSAPTLEELAQSLDAAERAYAALDVSSFSSSMDKAMLGLSCLDRPITPGLAARYHRLQGIRFFAGRDRAKAAQAFAAARSIEPDYSFPDTLLAPGHAARQLYGRLDLEAAASVTVPAPVSGSLYFDGVESLDRPATRATVVQVADGAGAVVETHYLLPEDGMPAYEAERELFASRRAIRSANRPMLVAAGVAVLGAGLSYGLSVVSEHAFYEDDPSYTLDDLDALRATTNRRAALAAGLGAVAVGTGVGAFFVGTW